MEIVCVYKSGGDFDAEYVVRLFFALEKYTMERNIDFICYTDVPDEIPAYIRTRKLNHGLHSWWSKMEIFEPRVHCFDFEIGMEFIGDDEYDPSATYEYHRDILYFDLDTVISKDGIDEMIDYLDTDERIPMIMLSDFYFPDRLASGIMYIPKGVQSFIWYSFYDKRSLIMSNYRGDQNFLERLFIDSNISRWDDILPDYIASYKTHVIKNYPKHLKPKEVDLSKTKIICYHGKPRCRDTNWKGL